MNGLVSFMFILQNMLCVCFLIMYVLCTLAFLMLPKGERKMGILRNQDVIFSRLKIKHKFKKKGGERDE